MRKTALCPSSETCYSLALLFLTIPEENILFRRLGISAVFFIASFGYADGEAEHQVPVIPSTTHIRTTLKEKSPIPEFSLSLFDTFVSGRDQTQVLRITGPQQVSANQIIPMGSSRINELVARASEHVRSTGDEGFDNALEKLRVRASNMAFQAALYDSLRALHDGSATVPNFAALEKYFKSIEDNRGDDGHFFGLNRDFLIAVAVEQYRAEFSLVLEHKLTEFARNPEKNNAAGFKEAIEKMPIEGREIVWKVAEKLEETRREFYRIQEEVRDGLALKFLPAYIDNFSTQEFDYVLSLITNKLRDLKLSAPVVNWCLQNARNSEDLLALLHNELTDATYIRFRSLKLNDPNADPYTSIPHQHEDDKPLPEEPFFTDVLRAILHLSETKFQANRRTMISRVFRGLLKSKPVSINFRIETLFRHIELMLGDGTHLEEWDQILRDVGSLIAIQAANEDSPVHMCGKNHAEQIQYLREEIVIRRKGWFPPTSSTFPEIFEILHNNANLNGGKTPEDPVAAMELAAARRALIDISTQVLSEVNNESTKEGARFLRSRDRSIALGTCLAGLLQAWQEGLEEEN